MRGYLPMTRDRVRDVGFLEPRDLLVAQRQLNRRNRVVDVLDFVAPTIGAVTPGLWSSHASATCGRRPAPLGGDLVEPVDDVEVGLRL